MVWGRMGLLDEAIREHLELKRRRGADPGEIAREEREALEPVFPDEPRPASLDSEPQPAPVLDDQAPHGDPLAQAASAHAEPAAAEPEPATADPVPAAAPYPAAHELSTAGQETAELDMEAVLEQDARLAAGAAPAVAHEHPPGEDDLIDWETPERSIEPPPEPLPGQERLTFE